MDIKDTIEQAKKGDRKAMGQLYDEYASKMRGVCIKALKGKCDCADDIVHDAFAIAFASIGKLRDPKRFGEWLTTITRNLSLKYLETEKNLNTVSITKIDNDKLEIEDNTEEEESTITAEELTALIDKLPEGYRNVFYLSVIKGMSHKEIAVLLGIEPHSSSSQLSRAKSMLKKMIFNYKTIAVVLISVLLIPLYKYIYNNKELQTAKKGVADISGKAKRQKMPKGDTGVTDTATKYAVKYKKARSRSITAMEIPIASTDISIPDRIDYITISANLQDTLIADDSRLEAKIKDVVQEIDKRLVAEDATAARKSGGWKMLLGGSLSPALAQNVYKIIATNDWQPDITSEYIPEYVRTWEEYYSYLSSAHGNTTAADTLALIDIAANNTGDIIESEHHDKPISIGFRLTKNINSHWSIETGLQYSLLKSSFMSGSDNDYILRRQKIHYIGIPLRLSYRIKDFGKHLSIYGAAGGAVNIPVSANYREQLFTGGSSVSGGKNSLTPPLQWSVNMGAGIQYNMTPNLGIYLEPTLNYYIPNGSSIHTTWTERPFTFSLPVGIRFTW